jgi:hypothetical protein
VIRGRAAPRLPPPASDLSQQHPGVAEPAHQFSEASHLAIGDFSRTIPGSMKLDQVDRKQRDVEKEDRINMSEHAVDDEQHVACDRHRSKRGDGGHAEACKHGERGCKSNKVDPRHVAAFRDALYGKTDIEAKSAAAVPADVEAA